MTLTSTQIKSRSIQIHFDQDFICFRRFVSSADHFFEEDVSVKGELAGTPWRDRFDPAPAVQQNDDGQLPERTAPGMNGVVTTPPLRQPGDLRPGKTGVD
jgi:hypothetical protein